jgi:hypothetical protein
MAAPGGLVPPLNLSLGSSAQSGNAHGGTGGSGMGSLVQGDWTIQKTGQGNNSATALPNIGGNGWMMAAIGAGVAWFMLRR